MFTFGYRDRKWRIVKDVCFLVIAVLLLVKGRTFGIILGALAGYWYGRDLVWQIQSLKREKPAPRDDNGKNDGKITITDLSDAKEVNFEKEQ